jgi:hypothetical protein
MEGQAVEQLIGTLEHLGVVLLEGSLESIVVGGNSLDNVLGSTVTGVVVSLSDLTLFSDGWDDSLSEMAALVTSLDSVSVIIDDSVVARVFIIEVGNLVLLQVFLHEAVSNSSEVTGTTGSSVSEDSSVACSVSDSIVFSVFDAHVVSAWCAVASSDNTEEECNSS